MKPVEMDKAEKVTDPADPEPHRVRLLSWNICGLDEEDREERTGAVCQIILEKSPDIVFLQEVVAETLSQIRSLCPDYLVISAYGELEDVLIKKNTVEVQSFPAPVARESYFTAMMFRAVSTDVISHHTVPFPTTTQGRNLLQAEVLVQGERMTLMTSHLESLGEKKKQRMEQLQAAFRAMKSAPGDSTAVFGGDLNLREKEIRGIGGLPRDIHDLWEVTGSHPQVRYTWNTVLNDNMDLPFSAKLRFDRLYLKQSRTGNRLQAVYFGFIGMERLKSCERFPSDHWGIVVHFDKKVR